MSEANPSLAETIECPLCNGKGELSRTEVLQRLGMKDYARVAQLSAEEAIRLLLKNEKATEQARWAKFELELTRRVVSKTTSMRLPNSGRETRNSRPKWQRSLG